MFYSRYHC